jgi:glucose/arabinose dehydrogenase
VRRLFVVEKGGRVKVVSGGKTHRRKYVNVSNRVATAGEGGLLSIAFSPRFKKDHLLWIAYARKSDGDLVVGRMRAPSANAKRVRTRTLKTVLRVEHSRYDNHYGGQLAFGPDNKLYVGTGDGGGGGDPLNTAGKKSSLLGKILRIDVLKSCGGKRYCSPPGNPYVDRKGKNQIWLLGLRNPGRFSFDRPTRSMWIGDVGQDAFEEVNRVPAKPHRRNLGWSCREGRQVYNASRCRAGVDYMGPRATVSHPQGESITGGYVYRGDKYRRILGGTYIFGDFVTTRVWVYKQGQGKHVQAARLGPSSYNGPSSFGVDDKGEILAVTYNGVLWRMRACRS